VKKSALNFARLKPSAQAEITYHSITGPQHDSYTLYVHEVIAEVEKVSNTPIQANENMNNWQDRKSVV
jgi:hypothetical protein